jgi:hypothetical protein
MPAAITNSTLLSAIADATEGKGVLFLVDQVASTQRLIERSIDLTIDGLRNYGGLTKEQAEGYVTVGNVSWRLNLGSGGWLFFFPVMNLKPHEDVGNPTYVYGRNNKGVYERTSYKLWKAKFPTPSEPDEDSDEFEKPPLKSVWSHLLEDD